MKYFLVWEFVCSGIALVTERKRGEGVKRGEKEDYVEKYHIVSVLLCEAKVFSTKQ